LITSAQGISFPGDQAVGIDSNQLRGRFDVLYSLLLTDAVKEEPRAVILALPEPDKVRVITKGPPLLYTLLKPMQKKISRILANFKIFKFTKEMVSSRGIQSVLGLLRSGRNDRMEKFLSVDYADATNELHSWVTDQLCDSIGSIWGLMPLEIELMKKALIHHQIAIESHERESLGAILAQSEQERAQLMGSVLSFVFLCITNGAVMRWTKEVTDHRPYKLDDLPVVINGDDAVIRLAHFGKKHWEDIANFCGLEPSVGKVYFSTEFLI